MMKRINKFREFIEFRSSISKISIEEIKREHPDLTDYDISKLLLKYLNLLLNENKCYMFFDQILNILLNEVEELDKVEKNAILVDLHEVYSNILYRMRKWNETKLGQNDIDIIKSSERAIRNYIENLEYNEKVEKDKFSFIWFVIDDLKAINFFKILIKPKERKDDFLWIMHQKH